MTHRDLKAIGKDIEEIDRKIFEAIARRIALSLEVERVKRATSDPIVRQEIEKDRMRRACAWALELDIDPHLGQALQHLLINGSRKAQLIARETAIARPFAPR